MKEGLLALQGADLTFAGSLLPFQGVVAQVDKTQKRRNGVDVMPLMLVVHRMISPLKRR